MFTRKLAAIGTAVAVALIVAGCSSTEARVEQPQSTVKPVAGSSVQQVQLTDQAMRRLGITTMPIKAATAAQSAQGARTVIPYAAVVYGTDGSTWTFAETAARSFVRQSITVRAIDGGTAILASGPSVGTPVVTVGATQLLGAEYDISGE
jgi:outer membrane murein-binding lipoprotein Lpp